MTGGDRPALHSAPLDVSNTMSAQVFSVMPVVMTSATLPRGLAARLGAPGPSTVELDVGSPFAYKANGLLYCAVRLPDRRRPEAEAAIHDEIEALVLAAGGRTLALFTSRRAMAAAAEVLAGRLPWPVLVQGDLPKAALLEALSSQSAACLFATMSFWQGVDVPGPALTLVVIDRIPFPTSGRAADGRPAGGGRQGGLPDRRPAAGGDASRPGRRAADPDRHRPRRRRRARPSPGAASYGPTLVKALPPMRRTRDRAEAEAFLRGIHAEAVEAEGLGSFSAAGAAISGSCAGADVAGAKTGACDTAVSAAHTGSVPGHRRRCALVMSR